MRAKLRFDLAALQGSVFGLRMGTASESCVLCGEQAADTRQHLLLHCPALDVKRSNLLLDLESEGAGHHALSDTNLLQFLLGNIQSNNRQSRYSKLALRRSASIIRSVFALRFPPRRPAPECFLPVHGCCAEDAGAGVAPAAASVAVSH